MNEQIRSNIRLFYGERLVKRDLPASVEDHVRDVYPDDFFVLTELGMPALAMEKDFSFSDSLVMADDQLLIIGKWPDNIYYDVFGGCVLVGSNGHLLAASVANLLRQVHFVDWFWAYFKTSNMLGNYRADQNNRRYANYFKNELLAIDPDLMLSSGSRSYYWGALHEDLENGIVG